MSTLAVDLTSRLEAHEPAEARGVARDDVRLLVADRERGTVGHARFGDLPQILVPGDLLVVNTSATLPAALPATRGDGVELELRLSTPAPRREGAASGSSSSVVARPPSARAGSTIVCTCRAARTRSCWRHTPPAGSGMRGSTCRALLRPI